MNEMNLGEQFLSNGFAITNVSLFTKELKASNLEPYNLLNKLIDLQKQANSRANIVDFSKDMLDKLNKLNEVFNKDDYFRLSDKIVIENISNDLTTINKNFEAIKNYLKAEEAMLFHKQNVLDVKRKIYEITNSTKLNEQEKTAETLRLQSELKACEEAFNNANHKCQEQKIIYNQSIQGTKVEDFKNNLLNAINSLDKNTQGLNLTESTRAEIGEIVQSMRNETANYALDNIKSQNEFDALCQKYGIKYDEAIRSNHSSFQKQNEPSTIKDADEEKIGKKDELLEPTPENKEPNLEDESEKEEKDNSFDDNEQKITPTIDNSTTKEEPKIKVVAKRACKWLNAHKKQILIAVGISLLIVATIIALQYLIPAVTAMLNAGEVATLSGTMINNGALWHGAIASEQAALHSANTALASVIQTMTGSEAIFNASSGIWTIGGVEISKFASIAAANAASAASTVSAITNGVLGLGITGLGLTGLGAILPKEKSLTYKNLLQKIKELNKNIANISHEQLQSEVNILLEEIKSNPGLTESEKVRLTKKCNKLINKSLTYIEDEVELLDEGKGR